MLTQTKLLLRFEKMSFSIKHIYETAVSALLQEERIDRNNFDPSIYPLVSIKRLSPTQKDSFDPKEETTYSVNWRFPCTIQCGSPAGVKKSSDSDSDDDQDDKTSSPPPLFLAAPGPVSVGCHISFPSGKLGQSSHNGGIWYRRNNTGKVAPDWPTYLQAYNKIVEQVCEAMQTSHYLGFNPKNPGKDTLQITLVPHAEQPTRIARFDVHISGSTDGWGEYDLETKKWDGLRHKHRARGHGNVDGAMLYCGENTPEKIFTAQLPSLGQQLLADDSD